VRAFEERPYADKERLQNANAGGRSKNAPSQRSNVRRMKMYAGGYTLSGHTAETRPYVDKERLQNANAGGRSKNAPTQRSNVRRMQMRAGECGGLPGFWPPEYRI